MTESEAIEVCKKKAKRRGVQLCPNVRAYLHEKDSLESEVEEEPQLLLNHWYLVFEEERPGLDAGDYFTINDSTGEVTWRNEPPSRWLVWLLCIVGFPLLVISLPFAYVIEGIQRFRSYYQLPRCPYCRAKLRTSSAQQCFTCGKAWHHPAEHDR